jgi:phosphoribosylaminoimidazole-succinocarboxamide synthase
MITPLPNTLATPPIVEGKTKILTAVSSDPAKLNVTFKDAATAFNGGKYAEFTGKGAVNARFSALLFTLLQQAGIPTCFIEQGQADNTLIYRALTMVPLEVVVRNVAYGSVCKRFGFSEGTSFKQPLIEFFYKKDALNDPQITEAMIHEMALLPNGVTLGAIQQLALACNEVLLGFFEARGIRCADYKLEMGLGQAPNATGLTLMLGDEMSPDNFRLRDIATGQVLDKDVFRLDLADLMTTYTGLLARLEAPVVSVTGQALKTYVADVTVHCRRNVLHPESKAIADALHTMGYPTVEGLRAGRRFQYQIQSHSVVDAKQQAQAMANQLLSNPVVEDATVEVTLAV